MAGEAGGWHSKTSRNTAWNTTDTAVRADARLRRKERRLCVRASGVLAPAARRREAGRAASQRAACPRHALHTSGCHRRLRSKERAQRACTPCLRTRVRNETVRSETVRLKKWQGKGGCRTAVDPKDVVHGGNLPVHVGVPTLRSTLDPAEDRHGWVEAVVPLDSRDDGRRRLQRPHLVLPPSHRSPSTPAGSTGSSKARDPAFR